MIARCLRNFTSKAIFSQGHLYLPNNSKAVVLKNYEKSTLKELKDYISSLGYSEVAFKSVEGANISSSTRLEELENTPYYIYIGYQKITVVPERLKSLEEEVLPLGTMEKSLDLELIKKYWSKVVFRLNLSNKLITKEELTKTMNEMLPKDSEDQTSLSEAKAKLFEYQKELQGLRGTEQLIEKKAERHAKNVLYLGLGVLVVQWSYIAAGTYIFYSWDIMEPQSYLIGLGNFVVGYGYYSMNKQDFTMNTIYNNLKARKKAKLYAKYNIDGERIQFLKEDSERLRNFILGIPRKD